MAGYKAARRWMRALTAAIVVLLIACVGVIWLVLQELNEDPEETNVRIGSTVGIAERASS